MDDGSSFEGDVRYLLSLQGWRVRPEILLGHKKVDCYADKISDLGYRERLVVECKDYSTPLSQELVTHVYANYLPLIQNNVADWILLVTRNGLSPSAVTYAATARSFIHLDYVGLLNSLLGFASYIEGLISQYRADEVSGYYIKQDYDASSGRYKDASTVEDLLLAWIGSDDTQPLAVLAGYGMGKTTLAKRIAYLLADRHKSDVSARIPVMIKLDELGSEQSLEGLLGKHFTSLSVVPHYNFHIFMELVKRGRFVILLDGFDEMKHAMSWESMRFNFQQLNRLLVGASKVILGGRPTVFLSLEEYQEALHGRRRVLGSWKPIPGWPEFREVHLKHFSEDQISAFTTAYLSSKRDEKTQSEPTPIASPRALPNFADDKHKRLFALASRPVQLKMLLEVLPSWRGELNSLTVTILYSEFIDLVIRREMEKQSRQRYTLSQRRQFATEMAWFLWLKQTGTDVTVARLPDSLFEKYMTKDTDLSEVKRDLLSACSIEIKQPAGYYFPHRSFQEFLVAEYLIANLASPGGIKQLSSQTTTEVLLTPEIREFIVEMAGKREAERAVQHLKSFRGTLPDWLTDTIISLHASPEGLLSSDGSAENPWTWALFATAILKGKWSSADPLVEEFLTKGLRRPPGHCRPQGEWAKLFLIMNLILSRSLAACDIDEKGRIVSLLHRSAAVPAPERRRKVSASHLLSTLNTRQFCYVSSWNIDAPQVRDRWYNLGLVKFVQEKDRRRHG